MTDQSRSEERNRPDRGSGASDSVPSNQKRNTSGLGNRSQGSDKAHDQTGTSNAGSVSSRPGNVGTNRQGDDLYSRDLGRGTTTSTGSSRLNDDEMSSDKTTTTTRSGDDGLHANK